MDGGIEGSCKIDEKAVQKGRRKQKGRRIAETETDVQLTDLNRTENKQTTQRNHEHKKNKKDEEAKRQRKSRREKNGRIEREEWR